MTIAKTLGLFVITAVCEIVGCYLPYLWLRKDYGAWLLAPAAISLALFAWLLTLHPDEAGRTYASYGGVYVTIAVVWLWLVNGQRPDRWDVIGSVITIAGMAVIAFGPHAVRSS
jgi:small multidrug resistance family-3 protein